MTMAVPPAGVRDAVIMPSFKKERPAYETLQPALKNGPLISQKPSPPALEKVLDEFM